MAKARLEVDPREVAAAYYALPLHERCYKALTKQFGLPDTDAAGNRLGRMIRDLEDLGLIRHQVLRGENELLPRNPELEDELRHEFTLRQAVVMDTSSLGPPKEPPSVRGEQWARYDDEIHERLGGWGGRLLVSCLRLGDTLATGGGRGPYFAVLNSNVCSTQRFSGDIVPLTGQISARAWNRRGSSRDAPPYLDADNVASQLHSNLGTRGHLLSLNCPITELRQVPKTDGVDVAVFGIGALGGGHRLKQFEHLDDVKGVRPLLRDINALAEEIEAETGGTDAPFYHPVGDVCNCYFVVEREPGARVGKRWRQLEAKVKELNGAFKSASPEALGRIAEQGMVLAVAGGPHKAYSIRHVLRNSRERTWITHLVTDQETARWILRQEQASGHGNGADLRDAGGAAMAGAHGDEGKRGTA
jgi:DNA-binding transcriptional regulator LsrR (DeoR family)